MRSRIVLLALVAFGCDGGPTPGEDGGPSCSTREVLCEDGRDDDCDGQMDCADSDCAASTLCRDCPAEDTAAACGNGTDDDCDEAVDCDDSDCAQNPVCGGAFVPPCDGVEGLGGNALELAELQFEATSDGLRATTTTDGLTVEIVVRTSTAGAGNLAEEPNGYLATCTHCILVTVGGRSYFPRSGTMTLTAIPIAPGEHLTGTVSGSFEEVTRAGAEVTPVLGGGCYPDQISFDGTLVASMVVSGRSARPAVATEGGLRQTGGGTPSTPRCGDGQCDNGEFGECTSDCECGPSTFTNECTDGALCPEGSSCVSRGRCACGTGQMGVNCSIGTRCDADPGTCAGTNWSCLDISRGCGNDIYALAVHCESGGYCPENSVCVDGGCACADGYEAVNCAGLRCSSANPCAYPNWYCRAIPPQVCGNGICESRESCAGCPGDCPCDSGCQACVTDADCSGVPCTARDCDGARACSTDANSQCGTIGGVGSCPALTNYATCTPGGDECGARATCLEVDGVGRCLQPCRGPEDCTASPGSSFDAGIYCSAAQYCVVSCASAGASCPSGGTCNPFSDSTYGYCW
jgi:hypothetical protein